jgi:hypothetical protein
MGLRKHQVENLVLRGPIFYWRARIPVGFRASGRNARLSLSLRLSDRKKASAVVRRLNALLLEMELVPKTRMATREQLAKIFALEADAMRTEIEALDRAAKRTGTIRDPEQRAADRQVGLAYRLLHAYGTGETLSFEEVFRARADALLASAADPRKPTPREARPIINVAAVVPPPKPKTVWADPRDTRMAPPTAANLPPVPVVIDQTNVEEHQSRSTGTKPAKKAPKNLPLSEFEGETEKLIANRQDEWEKDTASDLRVLVGIFRGILEDHGVTHSGDITQEHVAALRQHFNHILPNYGRSPRLRALSPGELRAESLKRADEGRGQIAAGKTWAGRSQADVRPTVFQRASKRIGTKRSRESRLSLG